MRRHGHVNGPVTTSPLRGDLPLAGLWPDGLAFAVEVELVVARSRADHGQVQWRHHA